MIPSSLVDRARAAFAADLAAQPPLSLRGGNDVDSYRRPAPFDPALDHPTDDYLATYAFWGLHYLDAQSFRHYVPLLIDYAARHGADHAMVTEALVRTLRPPDRYPPRLATFTVEQEAVVSAFLKHIASDPDFQDLQQDAQRALDEWWGPDPRSRPTADEIAALRTHPSAYRTVGDGLYRLDLPYGLAGSGVRDIPEERRRVEVWGGPLCGDAQTVVAANVTPLTDRRLAQSLTDRRAQFRSIESDRPIEIAGATTAWRLDGVIDGDSPAEPQALTIVLAATERDLVMLSIRTWPRDDLRREVERIVHSLRLDG